MVASALKAATPEAEVCVALEPEELGARLLFILRGHGGDQFTIHILLGALVRNGCAADLPG